jgi:hypothetical protein
MKGKEEKFFPCFGHCPSGLHSNKGGLGKQQGKWTLFFLLHLNSRIIVLLVTLTLDLLNMIRELEKQGPATYSSGCITESSKYRFELRLCSLNEIT